MLQAQNVSVYFGSHQVLKEVSLKITAQIREEKDKGGIA
jgi:ABC-type branched-subunit amino acid transport system ATPase component